MTIEEMRRALIDAHPMWEMSRNERITEKVDEPSASETKVEVDDEYLVLAESVGLDTPVVANELLKRCLKELKIFVYPTDHVERYLRSNFTHERQRLVWRALRRKDTEAPAQAVYDHPVPGHALTKADKLLRVFDHPNDLVFEVSDYVAVKPDPFLSVRIKGSQTRFVIAFWDEPNFRMEE